jgi:hypothetical protein
MYKAGRRDVRPKEMAHQLQMSFLVKFVETMDSKSKFG